MTDILPRLQTLKRLDLDCACFAARSHGYDLNPPVPEEEVARMEEKHGCRFPDEYRRFITELGNGGAGPAYGVFPLGMLPVIDALYADYVTARAARSLREAEEARRASAMRGAQA